MIYFFIKSMKIEMLVIFSVLILFTFSPVFASETDLPDQTYIPYNEAGNYDNYLAVSSIEIVDTITKPLERIPMECENDDYRWITLWDSSHNRLRGTESIYVGSHGIMPAWVHPGFYELDCIIPHEETFIPFIIERTRYNIVSEEEPIEETNNGSSSEFSDTYAPTMGMGNYKRMVDNGLVFNDEKIQVQKYTTHIALNAKIGQVNHATFKVYENNGPEQMDWVDVCIGLENRYKNFNHCEALIEMEIKVVDNIIDISDIQITDPNNLIEKSSIHTNATQTDCLDSNNYHTCTQADLYFSLRETSKYPMLAVMVADESHNKRIHIFNEGIIVIGDSLNPAKEKIVSGIKYTQTDKIEDIWESDGIFYRQVNENSYMQRIY